MFAVLLAVALEQSIAHDVRVDRPQGVVHGSFEAVAVSWSALEETTVRVRASADGARWSEWIDARIDEDLTADGRYVTGIVHFGTPMRYLEYSLTDDADHVNLTLFAPVLSGAPPPPAALAGEGAGAPQSPLRIRSRDEWGCPDGEASRWTPAYSNVTHAVVHHTAGANSVANWDAELRNIWYLHTVTNGWGDIGYNYLIDPDGVIYEGRAGGDGVIGAHFSCRNTNTVGVALLGTYITTTPTPAALDSLKRLLGDLCQKNRITPTAFVYHTPTGLNLPTIIGHRDGNPSTTTCSKTECPGDALYALLPSIRAEIPAPPRRRAVTH